MNRKAQIAVTALCILILSAAAVGAETMASQAGDLSKAPPGDPYRKVSDLVELPEFIPGMGTLYVDPSTLPVGPFLGYDNDGDLVHVTFMVPLSDLEKHQNFTRLAEAANWIPFDHADITYNPGHPGVAVPHYHITLWTISHSEEEALK